MRIPGNRREVWWWALYDFANSAFSTTVVTVVFSVYFVTAVAREGLYGIPGSALWALAVSGSTLISAFLAPWLGAVADASGSKKKFLFFFTLLGCLGTAGLFSVRPGEAEWGLLLFALANLGFAGAFSFYNAFLPELADSSRMGQVSGLGWALGYLGGGLCLGLNLWMVQSPSFFHISVENHMPVRATFLTVSVWWFLFSLPFFLWVSERTRVGPVGIRRSFSAGLRSLWRTLKEVRRYRQLAKFLLAYLFYNDGVETVIVMASVFAAEELGMGTSSIIGCFLWVQAVAFVGSIAFGRTADRWGDRETLTVSLWVWMGILFWALWMRSVPEFWISATLIGLVLGGTQAVSRSLYARLTPRGRSAEFFGFYSFSGKFFAVLGPLFFAVIRTWTGSPRWAIFSLLGFFAVGAMILYSVHPEDSQQDGEL
ncbi:MAG: MFS transporter [Elusimicrobia bacterium]|nr:MFS transporter [Elusimicrobiota bacterium]